MATVVFKNKYYFINGQKYEINGQILTANSQTKYQQDCNQIAICPQFKKDNSYNV